MGNALASLDTFERFYVHLSSLGLNEKVRENSHWVLQLRIIRFSWCSYQLSATPSVFGRENTHTHTGVISGLPKAQRLSGEVR